MESVNELKTEINELLDAGDYVQAKQKLIKEVQVINPSDDNYLMFLAESAGYLIDIGAESLDEEAAKTGIELLENNTELLKQVITEQSFNYCLGNGHNALFRIQKQHVNTQTLESINPYLATAKNYYFKAFKSINFQELEKLDLEILTNLGNNLTQAGRVVEAIRLYSSVLKRDTAFPQALIGYADDLDYWIRISSCPLTTSLFIEIYNSYVRGLSNSFIPPVYKARVEKHAMYYKHLLEKTKFDFSTMSNELDITQSEYAKHTDFRRFCIDNFLTLNEHSLFCKCKDSAKDDLSIIHSGIVLTGKKVGKMELLLNRLKSEFNLARKLFYEGMTFKSGSEETIYSDLMDGEVIGETSEKIKTSFRLCFGIFDKIAHGVCYFFELPKRKRDNIYFDRFWNDYDKRWEVLKQMNNPHLIALYSIANDLNSINGEFGFYKQWRNKLEHGNLILLGYEGNLDFFDLFDDEKFITQIPMDFFKKQALHLLQICCAAIYSYAYCIRVESLTEEENMTGLPLIFQPKSNW